MWGAVVNYNLPDGYYYLGNHTDKNNGYSSSSFTSNFYMCPAKGDVNDYNYLGSDSEKPLITTCKTFDTSTPGNDEKYTYAIWYIEAATGDGNEGCYYIKHVKSGKYLFANNNTAPNASRRRVNLGATTIPTNENEKDPYLFRIQTEDDGETILISPKTIHDTVSQSGKDKKYLNPSKQNFDKLYAGTQNEITEGILGFWYETTNNSLWHFVPALSAKSRIDAPIVFTVGNDKSVTLSSDNPNVSLYYTVGSYDDNSSNPDDPKCISASNITGNLYNNSAIQTTDGKRNVIKVIAVITEDGVTYSSLIVKKTVDRREDIAPAYDGVYYLQNNANKNYYLYPANENIITKQAKDLLAVWKLEKIAGTGAHHIIHYSDNKYLFANPSSVTNTLSLVTTDDPGDNALFVIEKVGDDYYTIKPLYADNNGENNYLNPTGGNNGTNTIGLSTAGNDGSKWVLGKIPAPPTFTVSDNKVTMTKSFGDVYYKVDNRDITTDDATAPTVTSGTKGTSVTLQYGPKYYVNAICAYCYDNTSDPKKYWESDNAKKEVQIALLKPTISYSGNTVTISSIQNGVSFKYTTDDSDPKTSGTSGSSFTLTEGQTYTVRAYAYNTVDGITYWSDNEDVAYINLKDKTEISSLSEISDQAGNYILSSSFSGGTPQDGIGTSSKPFKGTIEGYWDETNKRYNPISLSAPLFECVENAVIKNVIVASGDISGNGAIANEAKGSTKIYNCGYLGGTITGSGNVGSIVGDLNDDARVINCFSFATVAGGTNCGGIVGYNHVASTSGNLRTMVMNCMFYGDITGNNPAPVYGGEKIHNKPVANNINNTGLNNYNYFLYKNQGYLSSISTYDIARGALGAEERFLNRFEFFRLTLNSTRSMAAFYVCGDATQKELMAKWVLDKSIAPYPILKKQDYYPSIINPDAAHAENIDDDNEHRNEGRKLTNMGSNGQLSVTIQLTKTGDNPFGGPSSASLKADQSATFDLNITDKDFNNSNFNYGKVQLPYFNNYCTGNYTKASDDTSRVVTGWKIVSITVDGTVTTTGTGSYSTGADVTFDGSGNITATPYNYVDRNSTKKDLYSVSKRVFNQGAYWEVPKGVTAITIEPYWAKCVYLSDANYDVTYDGTTKYGVSVSGSFSKPTDLGDQTVYNSVNTAFNNLGSNASYKVYDYAIVLVGNYHQYADAAIMNNADNKPVTFMSADLDGDCEPDNTLFYYHKSRQTVSPIRFDFLNIPGVGTVKRTWNSGMNAQPGIFKPKGWFEITNTVVIRFGQFEYANAIKTIEAPLILQGGIYEQFVSSQNTDAPKKTNYLLIGGNAWFNTFANGCHTEKALQTPKVPVNVTGGEYKKFYLSGIYQATVIPTEESAECYIDGGKFEEVAGSGMQKIDGNVTWFVNGADITKFYGGGINAAQAITGNIRTTISNSYVDEFYGGPKFGDVANTKTVITKADNCHFGKFYGAGFGGTAFNRFDAENYQVSASSNTTSWSTYVTTHYKRKYDSSAGKGGISTSYEYEYILHSDGSQTVARFFVNYASLSLASTRDVTSNLNGCIIGTFFGGGRLGAVNGDVNSTLTDCHVTGNVFGGGFSADAPTVDVWPIENMTPAPTYDRVAGVFNNASVQFPTGVEYTWKHAESVSAGNEFNETDGHYILTTVNLDGLGAVNGNATLNLKGGTIIDGNVYGGGDSSPVNGSTTVNILE